MDRKYVVVTLDGPSGSGKSSVARRLASELGFRYLDTGAMYRTVALAALRTGLSFDPLDEEEIARLLDAVTIDLDDEGRALLDGEAVGDAIRDGSVTRVVSDVSALEVVRRRMVELQRAFGARGDLVAEGRDMGSIVFPEARHRFYLDADPAARARRRARQISQKGWSADDGQALTSAMEARDRKDSRRALAPLSIAPGMVVIDTTEMTLDEVVATLVEKIRSS